MMKVVNKVVLIFWGVRYHRPDERAMVESVEGCTCSMGGIGELS